MRVFLNESMTLTALTEVNTVVVDVCGEKQEAWQRQAVLQRDRNKDQWPEFPLKTSESLVSRAGKKLTL